MDILCYFAPKSTVRQILPWNKKKCWFDGGKIYNFQLCLPTFSFLDDKVRYIFPFFKVYFLIFGFQCDVFSQSRRIRNEELLTDYICSFFTWIFALWAFQCVEIIFGGSLQWRQRHFWYWRDFQTQQSASTLFEY